MTEEIKPEEETIDDIFEDETDEVKPTDGDDTDEALLTPEELSKYNERTGKNYKKLTWDEIAKKEKIADEAFRTKRVIPEKAKQEVKTSIDDEVIEELLLTKNPEAEFVLDELKETAKLKGISVLKLYRESKYFQGEAMALSDAKKSEEENRRKIKAPSNGAIVTKDFSNVKTSKDLKKLSVQEKVAFFKNQLEKERG